MDINKYISSGILENYVLGLISENERREVEEAAANYPAIQNALFDIEDALKSYIQANAMPLPAGLKAAVMAKIDAEIGKTPTAPPTPGTAGSVSRTAGLLGLLALALAAFCFYLFNQNKNIQNDLSTTNNQLKVLKKDCDTQAARLQDLQQKIAILRDTAKTTVIMKGQPDGNAPAAIAAVHINTASKKVFLDVIDLPEPPAGKQYQLWALVDGQPVDMGVFDLQIREDGSFIEVPFVENAGAYAVTLEDAGGRPTPNLDQLFMIGNT